MIFERSLVITNNLMVEEQEMQCKLQGFHCGKKEDGQAHRTNIAIDIERMDVFDNLIRVNPIPQAKACGGNAPLPLL